MKNMTFTRAVLLAFVLGQVLGAIHADAAEWPWSRATAHLSGRDGHLVQVGPMLAMIDDWRGFLDSVIREEETQVLRDHGRTGHPLGSATFVQRLEQAPGRRLRPKKPGRPSKLLKQPN